MNSENDDPRINLSSKMSSENYDSKNKEKTYAELSKEFRELYPTVVYAFQLIPKMYNTLTLIDKLSHKSAVRKIYQDHKDLSGFSARNIRRFLPTDNACIPRRIRTRRPKVNAASIGSQGKLATTKTGPKQFPSPLGPMSSNQCHDCKRSRAKIEELEEALAQATAPVLASTIMQDYYVPKEKLHDIISAAGNCNEVIYLKFDSDRCFIAAESDCGKTKPVTR